MSNLSKNYLNSDNVFINININVSKYTLHSRHFGSYQQSKLSVTQHQSRYSMVKSSQFSWAGQYKKCVQYDFQFTSEHSAMYCSKSTYNKEYSEFTIFDYNVLK